MQGKVGMQGQVWQVVSNYVYAQLLQQATPDSIKAWLLPLAGKNIFIVDVEVEVEVGVEKKNAHTNMFVENDW